MISEDAYRAKWEKLRRKELRHEPNDDIVPVANQGTPLAATIGFVLRKAKGREFTSGDICAWTGRTMGSANYLAGKMIERGKVKQTWSVGTTGIYREVKQ